MALVQPIAPKNGYGSLSAHAHPYLPRRMCVCTSCRFGHADAVPGVQWTLQMMWDGIDSCWWRLQGTLTAYTGLSTRLR